MADVRPFRALRYAPRLDLSKAICPPFDIISREQQRELHERSPHNAVRVELAFGDGRSRYERAAEALGGWREDGTLARDASPAFYIYDQQFELAGARYSRRLIFARLRLEPWEKRVVLPHERTFGAPKEDRMRLLRAIRTNTSPVFLIYRDEDQQIETAVRSEAFVTVADFTSQDGQTHTLRRIDSPSAIDALSASFEPETMYIADGHHRYETALAFQDECRAAAAEWTGDEPENFVLVAMASARDPGLSVLPIHRVTSAGVALAEALERMTGLFSIEQPSREALEPRLAAGCETPAFGLASAESEDLFLLTVDDPRAVDALLPQDRSAAWRSLDYTIANQVILQHILGLESSQMSDYHTLWFTEDADEALRDVRSRRARYALVMNPLPVRRVLDVADAGERMPQKSTFFYPKVPTGIVFNSFDD